MLLVSKCLTIPIHPKKIKNIYFVAQGMRRSLFSEYPDSRETVILNYMNYDHHQRISVCMSYSVANMPVKY